MRIPKSKDGFWEMGNFETDFPGAANPWTEGSDMAPFDTEFYLIMNLALGGSNHYWSDDLEYTGRHTCQRICRIQQLSPSSAKGRIGS